MPSTVGLVLGATPWISVGVGLDVASGAVVVVGTGDWLTVGPGDGRVTSSVDHVLLWLPAVSYTHLTLPTTPYV